MKLGAESKSYKHAKTGVIDYEAAKRHGFDCIDYQDLCDMKGELCNLDEDSFRASMAQEKARADAAGIEIYQVHGPWPTDDTSAEKRAQTIGYMKRGILGTALLGSNYFIVHPVMPYGWGKEAEPETARRLTAEMLTEIAAYAAPLGVTVCLENMPFRDHAISTVENTASLVEELDLPNVKICLDTGHANVFATKGGDMVRRCGKNLATLHVHDNGGWADSHNPPYQGRIDWDAFRTALGELGFDGCLSLETGLQLGAAPDEVWEAMMHTMQLTAKSLCP